MQKKIAYIFLAVSLVFFLFVTGLSGYRIETARRTNSVQAMRQADLLLQTADAAGESAGGFDSPYFRQKMREAFDGEPRLLLLSIHSEEDGMLYLVSRNRSYLRDPAEASPDWRGTPSYRASRGYEKVVSLPFPEPREGVSMDGLFVVLGREDLFAVVRDDLFLFLAFLLVSGILIVIMMGIGEDQPLAAHAKGAATAPRPGSGARPDPTPRDASAARPGAGAPPGPSHAKGLTSPVSGLAWAEHFEVRLKTEIERAASSDLDLALACIRIDNAAQGDTLKPVYTAVARLIRESFPLADLAFEAGPDAFALIMPDTDIDQAIRHLEGLRGKVAAARAGSPAATLSIGASSRGGRLIEGATLAEEAGTALRKAAREGGNRVIGFRADAARYRESLSVAGA
jgi:diguanylate cyclase (GGDEF)-like protein